MFEDWADKLKSRLSEGLPGAEAQLRMAPAHRPIRMPEPSTLENAHQGAVLLLLYPLQGAPHLVLTRRPEYEGAHSGQISLPGGKIEPEDADESAAALREAWEETGVMPEQIEVIGRISPLYIPPSNFYVKPIIGISTSRPAFQPDPVEVAEIIEAPVSLFLDESLRKSGSVPVSGRGEIHVPYYDVFGHRVWGATAIMLSEFSELIRAL